MPKENYLTKSQLTAMMSDVIGASYNKVGSINTNIYNTMTDDEIRVKGMLTKKMSGIEGMPYQFLENVDRRLGNTDIGRKYAEKIIARLPLLFLVPVKQVFLPDGTDQDRQNLIDMMLTGNNTSEFMDVGGRYYTVESDYARYYRYFNTMMAALTSFLGLYDEKININGKSCKLGTYDWQSEMNEDFKSFFSAAENLVFYLDGMTSVSESYSNDTTESSLASQINGYSDTANELKFLFGESGGLMETLYNSGTEITTSLSQSLAGVFGSIGGGIVQSLADKGVNTILNGGKIIFPEIWSNSHNDKSYSIDIKLRSPDHDSLSIFLNVLKPYCRILALVLPRLMGEDDDDPNNILNPNGYGSPFLVKAYCKGMFNIDMGIISSMSVTKGAECCWNDDGLPTQIDISLDIKDLYNVLVMSSGDKTSAVVNNTSYMDYLANMAGLNLAQMEMGRKIKMYYYLTQSNISQIPSRLFTRFDQSVTRLMGRLYETI